MSLSRPVQRLSSVGNAPRVLKEFSRTKRDLGATQLARRLVLAVSTVHRLLAALCDEALLERGRARGTCRLGLKMEELGVTVFRTSISRRLRDLCWPPAAVHGGDRQMGVLDHLEVVYIERLESP